MYVRSWWNKCYILWSKSRGCDRYWSNISLVIMTFTQNSDTFLISPTLKVSNGKCFINGQHIKINHFWFSLYRPSMKHKSWKHTLPSRHVLAPSLITFMLSHCLPNLLRAVTLTNRPQHCLRFCRQLSPIELRFSKITRSYKCLLMHIYDIYDLCSRPTYVDINVHWGCGYSN